MTIRRENWPSALLLRSGMWALSYTSVPVESATRGMTCLDLGFTSVIQVQCGAQVSGVWGVRLGGRLKVLQTEISLFSARQGTGPCTCYPTRTRGCCPESCGPEHTSSIPLQFSLHLDVDKCCYVKWVPWLEFLRVERKRPRSLFWSSL